MKPVPKTPTVISPSSRAGRPGRPKSCASVRRTEPFTSRSSASSDMRAYSETAFWLYTGTFAQRRPYFAAAARSMWSQPVLRVRTYLTPAPLSARALASSMRLAATSATAFEPRASEAVSGVSRPELMTSSTPRSAAISAKSRASSSRIS